MKRIFRRHDQSMRFEAALCGVNLPAAETALRKLELSDEQEALSAKAMNEAIERNRREMTRG